MSVSVNNKLSRSASTGSLERGIDILEVLAASDRDQSLSTISSECGLPLSTTHRILLLLLERRLVSRDKESKKYSLFEGSLLTSPKFGLLRKIALAVMVDLARATGETVLLNTISKTRDSSLCVERVEGIHDLRLAITVGALVPLHVGALQQALLAFMPVCEIREYLKRPLTRVTSNTIVEPSALSHRLLKIRNVGYAWAREETSLGVSGIGIPLLNSAGTSEAVLGIAGPSVRLNEKVLPSILEKLKSATTEIAIRSGLEVSISVKDINGVEK